MSNWIKVVVACSSLLFAACSSNIALARVSYEGNSRVHSSTPLLVDVTTVAGSANDVEGVPLLISASPLDRIRFNETDQKTFSDSLKGELVRMGMFSHVAASESQQITRVNVIFSTTNYIPQPFFEYRLGFRIQAWTPGQASFSKDYVVSSSDGLTNAQKWGMNVSESKQRIAHLALARIILDLEQYMTPVAQ